MNKIVLTGDRPTGPLHLGHYVGSLKNRLDLQNQYQQYLMIADLQALTDNFDNPGKVKTNVFEVLLDYLATGIDPQKTTIFLQSKIPQLANLSMLYLNLVSIARLQRNPTVKAEIKQKNLRLNFDDMENNENEKSVNAGFFCYPVSQAADITLFLADLVPVGADQLPMIEQTNEIVEKFNHLYKTNFLKRASALLSNCNRLPGIDGQNKMSKSLGNAIFLKDSNDEIARKVKMCYTDPNHIKITDPGQIEGNVVFSYLDAFYEDKNDLIALKEHYTKGGLGDSILKKKLTDILINLIEPIRQRREELSKNPELLKKILLDGCEKAHITATNNFAQIEKIMQLDY